VALNWEMWMTKQGDAMSADRFDELTRTLAAAKSRRAALKGLAGWAAKGVAVALGVSAAAGLSTQTASAHIWCLCGYNCNGTPVFRCESNSCRDKIHALHTTCTFSTSTCAFDNKAACETF
jgi:hypothetical protein